MINYETIRAACIAANPEIVELKFGCEVLIGGTDRKRVTEHLVRYDKSEALFLGRDSFVDLTEDHRTAVLKSCYETHKPSKASLEILGREIQLADVLLATKFGWQEAINLGSTISMKITHTFSPFGT